MSDSVSSSQERFANLTDSNWLEWKDNMTALLKARGLRKYIDAPYDAADGQDQKAQGLITIKIDRPQRVNVYQDTDNARTAWLNLCAKYELVGTQLAISFFNALLTTRYQDGEKLDDHFAKLREQMMRFEAAGNVLVESSKVGVIVNSLPPSWEVFKSIYSRPATPAETVSSVVVAALAERDRRVNEQRTLAATQSLVQQQLAGSPSAFAVREQQEAAARAARKRATCTWCLKRGHIEEECFGKRDGKPRADPRADRHGNAYFATEPATAPPDRVYHVYTALSTTPAAGVWYLDSGASNHYCREASLVDSVQPCAKPSVVSADGSSVPIVGNCSVTLRISPARRGQPDRVIKLTGVSLVPGLATNLVSVARLTAAGLDVRFSTSLCVIRDGKQVVAVADLDKTNNLYRLRTAGRAAGPGAGAVIGAPQPQYCLAAGEEAKLLPSALWHQRLAHVHHRAVADLLGRGMTVDVHQAVSSDVATCHACIQGKHHRAAAPANARAQHRADRPLLPCTSTSAARSASRRPTATCACCRSWTTTRATSGRAPWSTRRR